MPNRRRMGPSSIIGNVPECRGSVRRRGTFRPKRHPQAPRALPLRAICVPACARRARGVPLASRPSEGLSVFWKLSWTVRNRVLVRLLTASAVSTAKMARLVVIPSQRCGRGRGIWVGVQHFSS